VDKVAKADPILMASPSQLSHLEQYKTLRDEILRVLDEMRRTEFWGAAATGAVYAWLLTHPNELKNAAIWWIGPIVVLVCGIRCLLLFDRIRTIAVYLRRIEDDAFAHQRDLPGWERYMTEAGGLRIVITTVIAWVFMLALSVFASLYLPK